MVLATSNKHSDGQPLPVIDVALCDWRETPAGFARASHAPAADAHS